MTIQLQKFRPRDIIRDVPAEDLDPGYYSDGQNVSLDDGFATRVQGYSSVYPGLLANPQWLLNTQTELTNYWIYAGEDLVSVWNGLSHVDITPAGGLNTADVGDWSGGVLNDVAVWNNDQNPPHYWPLTGLSLELPGWYAATFCKVLIPYKYFLVAMNINGTGTFNGEFGNLVLWSDAADPGTVPQTWQPLDTNAAGTAELSETPGQIVAAAPLRDSLLIYKQHSVHIMQFVGGNNVMEFRTLFTTTGALSKNCVVEVQGTHVILSDGDVMQTDGNTIKSIIDHRNRRWLFSRLDSDNYRKSFVAYNRIKNEVWICFPDKDSDLPNIALTWSVTDNTWGARELPQVAFAQNGIISEPVDFPLTWDDYNVGVETWDSILGLGTTWAEELLKRTTWLDFSAAWNDVPLTWNRETFSDGYWGLMMCSPTPQGEKKLYSVDTSNSADGANVFSYIRRETLDFGTPARVKTVRRIYPRLAATSGTEIRVRLGVQNNPDEQVRWTPDAIFRAGIDDKVDIYATGKYISIQFTTDDRPLWSINGFDLEYEERGNW